MTSQMQPMLLQLLVLRLHIPSDCSAAYSLAGQEPQLHNHCFPSHVPHSTGGLTPCCALSAACYGLHF